MRFLGLLLTCAALLAPGAAAAAELGPRTSSASGVTVKVTPKRIAPDAAAWEFAVVLDTHSQDLGDDLLSNAALVDAQGGRHTPLAWDEAAPGGHHREGVLRFKGQRALPEVIELQIRRPGESAPRIFRWKVQ